MDNESPHITPAGIDRRSLLKRGAVVGGALVWTTPVVQTLAGPAFAQEGPGSDVVIVGCPPGSLYRIRYENPEGIREDDFQDPVGGAGADCLGDAAADAEDAPASITDDITVAFVRELDEEGEIKFVTVTLGMPETVRITDAAYKSGQAGCVTGTPNVVIAADGRSVTFTSTAQEISNIQLLLSC